mmetsp:Transcript_5924/g.8618  ORF Transcript_5924/g.8618 Transcript_5924/m.8618 type:complete len:1175 (+) Transcript_5924:291-3815(+)|eukprot:CAMPEP_0184872830 /NCGR_PEP_ID=MMETSP0580-20130426/41505_1 /TAXON_ID=1118495 /ORGANISM="Dactyliosolen fragilissimus" /LENGTH=1174 /DNA_ID=CAMNT_0027375675 /DNA_START=1973 /DNA_END=5497 /DNA_ORIENTATION=+
MVSKRKLISLLFHSSIASIVNAFGPVTSGSAHLVSHRADRISRQLTSSSNNKNEQFIRNAIFPFPRRSFPYHNKNQNQNQNSIYKYGNDERIQHKKCRVSLRDSSSSDNNIPSTNNDKVSGNSIDNPNESLTHELRAPTSSQSSGGTYNLQEKLFRAEEDKDTMERQKKIQEILEKDDQEWREQRRKQKMGKYADVKNMEEWKKLEEEERMRIERENKRKAKIAEQAGVTLDLLEKEPSTTEESNLKQTNLYARKKSSWFEELDNDLNNELEAELSNFHNDAKQNGEETEDMGPRFVNGKLVGRDQQMGVRVGSAGGWSLEVFPGDFVVHRKYGIGRFDKTIVKSKNKLTEEEKKTQTIRRNEIIKEMIRDKYNTTAIENAVHKFGSEEDEDPISNPQQAILEVVYSDAIVHIPVDKAYRLSRYRAGDSVIKPRLSRVKGGAWNKAKKKVEEDTIQMAQDVLALYATRETLHRRPFDPKQEENMRDFEKTFPYEPTPDQQKCFEAVENDMVWRGRPMDRLVCGDVGFGKTEVALRALFRSVANGRQAALLAPTGVLAAQHMKNILIRMGEESQFNFKCAMLRGGMGKNTKAGRALRKDISDGKIDIIVGTHALLSTGMKFNDLGLLVVDEEQRFGVKQKERLKLICNGVDVLTLSATPIPRTLQMSLSGIRDTSTIRSPPPMRKPTQSFVLEFSKDIIKEAINRELERGGQCYFVVPRIAQLDEAEKIIQEVCPGIRLIQAHGRMPRDGAEENVASFAEGNHDVLLATTVIENGVDIPTVNTIIIQNAQAFGMSTLYQLRGRVGRSSLQAYAYFLHKEESITEQSALRLQAMADLHELGSGFDVANRDLEIRGAGSLLGTEQSGMATKVGFDLYMRMLKKSIRQLRGLDLPMVPRTNVLLPGGEGSIEIASQPGEISNAFQIPKSYIHENSNRMTQEGMARLAESTEQLVNLTNSWKKEFGPLPASLQGKMKTLHLHACTRTLGIDLIGLKKSKSGGVDCVLRSPGLRPRHWVHICKSLPKGIPTKGLDVVFPARFGGSGEFDIIMRGGKKIDEKTIMNAQSFGQDDEEWDALDQEEVEAMKEISSAAYVKNLDEIDVDDYPRFVIREFGNVGEGVRVDVLLKVLLPASKVVFTKQQGDKEKAKVAAELREKKEMIKKQKKEMEKAQRDMYNLF